MISFMIVGLIVAVSSNVKWKGTVEDEEEQDKFFKENAVTAKCHAYLRHLNDHFSRESFRAAWAYQKKRTKRRVRPRQRYMRKNM